MDEDKWVELVDLLAIAKNYYICITVFYEIYNLMF
jgi:hypothetical protein